jgi:hypothetical protein
MRTITNEEGEPTVKYKIPIHERAASLLVWLASRENKTATEYIQKIVTDYLHSSLTQLDDNEARELGVVKVNPKKRA